MTPLIVDYGMGNLASIANALKTFGVSSIISHDPVDLAGATHVILPGQGAFKDGMKALQELGWVEPLRQYALQDKKPLLGICLGMQLLATKSYEMGETYGLNVIPGEVTKLKLVSSQLRLPHVGWNSVSHREDQPWCMDVKNQVDFYFVHSYHFETDQRYQWGITDYGKPFCSVVGFENVLGVQFHPEKSAIPGRRLLMNFINGPSC